MNEQDNHKGQRHRTISFPQIRTMEDQLEAIADYYWVCEKKRKKKNRVRATLPKEWKGICTRVRLLQGVTMIEGYLNEVKQPQLKRQRAKRAYEADPNVYAIGQPRGIPEKYKVDVQVDAGVDVHTWDWFNSLFGSWGQWLTKVGIIIGIVVVVFLLLFCCIVPFIRSMLASAAAKQMINVSVRPTGVDIGCTNLHSGTWTG